MQGIKARTAEVIPDTAMSRRLLKKCERFSLQPLALRDGYIIASDHLGEEVLVMDYAE